MPLYFYEPDFFLTENRLADGTLTTPRFYEAVWNDNDMPASFRLTENVRILSEPIPARMEESSFRTAVVRLFPGGVSETISTWIEFVKENVDSEQYVNFVPEPKNVAAERWLNSIYSGLKAVKEDFGEAIAEQVCNLGDPELFVPIRKDSYQPEQLYCVTIESPYEAAGPEIGIGQTGVPYGLIERRTEPGYLLKDGTVLLECERDAYGNYQGGVGVDGMYLKTDKLYAPVIDADGKLQAFRKLHNRMLWERNENPPAVEMNTERNDYQIDGLIPNKSSRLTSFNVEAIKMNHGYHFHWAELAINQIEDSQNRTVFGKEEKSIICNYALHVGHTQRAENLLHDLAKTCSRYNTDIFLPRFNA